MGAKTPLSHRCFTMRNPLAKALILTAGLFIIVRMLASSERLDVRSTLLRTGASVKEAFSSQRPLGHHGHHDFLGDELHMPIEQDSANQTESAGHLYSNASIAMTCDYNMDRLRVWQKKYGLGEKFEYTKRYVRPSRQNVPRKSMTKLRQNFLPDQLKAVNISKSYKPERCPEPIALPVSRSPFPSTANASDFMFGVSTTYKRFSDPQTSPVNDWTFWLTDGQGSSNGGKLLLLLMDATIDELEDARDQLTAAGVDADVYRSDGSKPMAVRYLSLVPTMYNHPLRQQKKWLVTCDDDTFFPYMHELTRRFHAYDSTQPMYIGTFSEDVNNVARHGPQAFGGAGVFLSLPTAQQISEDFRSCVTKEKIEQSNTGWGPQGDVLLRKCIYENSETVLTLLNDLWQLDMFGDPSGFYESGIKPLSLHHYRGGGWHIAHPWHYTKVARICGEDCTLQRFQTADDFIISNGFSVAYYPEGIDFNTHQFEKTFGVAPEDKGWNLDYAFGPQRASLHKTGRKISWDLQEAIMEEDGSVSQIYVRKHDDWRWKNEDGSAMSDLDGVVELVWLPAGEPEGEEWK